ncbi:MAG TPA: hypothetical protein DD490_35235 [Acidobacteria bacterium]|nr:hypothetical protein [Acidobacteriota bacterium]
MTTPLSSTGTPIRIGTITLRTPGLAGMARVLPPQAPATRASTQSTDAFEQALLNAGISAQETIEISDSREVGGTAGPGTRSTAYDEPAIEITVPDAGEGWGQFLLSKDESGVITWHFPVDEANRLDVRRGSATRTYVVRRYVATPEQEPQTRGLLGAIGKKILKVLAFRLVKTAGGEIGDYFVRRWEEQKRPHRFRSFLPGSYASADVPDLGPADWPALLAGPALLMIHGTASRTHVGFGGLDQETVRALHERYGGRVFAFDHPTLSLDPRQNAEWFFASLPEGARLTADIVCHSRGGLVARMLAEQEGEFSPGSRSLAVRRLIFVATPNAGTILADGKYMADFLDTYTNLLNFLPDNGVTEVFEGLIEVGKQVAVGMLEGLDGLQSMLPGGRFLSKLNHGARDGKKYFALSSHYEPTVPGWKAWAVDRLLDKIFVAENDLVVPTQGVFDRNGSGFFPIADREIFSKADGIAHTRFFRDPRVRSKILEWLG